MTPDRISGTARRRWVAPWLALAIGATVVGAAAPAGARADRLGVPDSGGLGETTTIVVEGVGSADLSQIRRAAGARAAVEFLDELGAVTVEVPADSAAPTIRSLERQLDAGTGISIDAVWTAFGVTPNDPNWATYQGSYVLAGLPNAWSSTTGSSSTVIAVLDSGVNPVSELSGRLLAGTDFVDDDGNPADPDGHGTSSALVAAAAGNNSANGAGACWGCLVLPVRVLDAEGSGLTSDIAAGIVWATDNGADVINLSLGGAIRSSLVAAAVRYAAIRNVVVVASASNDGTSDVRYPASEPGVVSVAGAQDASTLYPWSQRGSWIDVAAPGCNYSWSGTPPIDPNDFYFCGTSSAAPMVSGVVGLMRSIRPGANRVMVSNSLRTGAPSISTGPSSTAAFLSAAVAVDRVGSAADGPELDNNPLDVSGPAVAMGSEVTPGRVIGGTIRLSTSASDPAGISTWDLLVDNGAQAGVVPLGGSAGVVDFHSTSVGDGTRTLAIRAVDGFGIESRTASVPVIVDNTRPGLLIAAPTSGRGGRPVTVTVGVVDANTVVATFLAIGNQVVGGFVGAGLRQFPVVLPRSGRHRLVAASIDVAGNLSFSNMVFVTVRR